MNGAAVPEGLAWLGVLAVLAVVTFVEQNMYKCEHPTKFNLGWGIPILILATASIAVTLLGAACKCVMWIAEHPWVRIFCGAVLSGAVCLYFATYSDASECRTVDGGVRHTLLYLPIGNIILFVAAVGCGNRPVEEG